MIPTIDVAQLAHVLEGASGEAEDVTAPWDGSVIARLPRHTVSDLDPVVERARAAQQTWARTRVSERTAVARRFARLVLDRKEQILDVIQAETGKSRVHALEELLDVSRTAAYYAHTASSLLKDHRRAGAIPVLTSTREIRHPKGVVGVIAPWNYPFTLAVSDAIPALLAGNAVVLKPDSNTPLSALIGVSLLREAGLPTDLMQVMNGPGSTVGQGLIDRVDYMMFTGSTATGTAIAQRCAARLIGFSAELGGKNALVVAPDADIERAASGAVRASFSNAGQLCISIERIFVTRDIAGPFIDAVVRRTAELTVGAGMQWAIDVGTLISTGQLETVQGHVDDAVAKGATVLAGGHALPEVGPSAFAPTVLTNVPPEATLFSEETFGPVVSIYVVNSLDEAIARANDSSYGLNASIWTKRHGKQARLLQAGTVNVNEGYAAAWASHDAPMGGWKQSGVGRRHGAEGLWKFTETQTVSHQRWRPVGPWPGISNQAYERFMTAAVKVLNTFR